MFREDSEYIQKPVQKPETIFSRIAKADNNTLKKAQQLLSEYGIKKAQNRLELYGKLVSLYKTKSDEVIPKILEIHPDKELFENYFNEINSEKLKQTEKQHQAELSKMRQMFDDQIKEMKMDLRFAGIKNYGDDGSVSGNTNNANQSRSTDLIIAGSIIGVLGVIGLSLVAMSHSKS